ncbi:MAG: DNA recombination protein RmuC [Alphaproteobacteria bacterium]|nr:DNA recombination protein RmuC [Alphaproteobacteria bacterium]
MEVLTLTSIVGAAAAGGGTAWLIAAAKLRVAAAEATLLRNRIGKIEADLESAVNETNIWRTQAENDGRARVAAETAASRVSGLENEANELRRQLMETSAVLSSLRAKLAEQERAHTEKVEALTAIRGEIDNNLRTIASEALRGNQSSFFNLANEVFDKHKAGASAELAALVSPIRETLQAYQADLAKLENERASSNGALSSELKNVVEAQYAVRIETSRLVNALRAAPKTRGRWGENTLRNVLELAGLNAHSDFATEQSYDRDGVRSRPDVVIRLPGGRNIVVDAKTSMAAYLDAVDSTDDEARERHLVVHAQQLRSQVKLLAGKSYWDGLTETPDFVLMFVPGENFYAAAAERDPELFEFAAKQRVLIVTPATLIALAKAVAYSWRQEKVAENAKRVHDLGRDLYKRLSVMGGYIAGLGKSLAGSVHKYNEFIGSLEGSVMPQARRFQDLEVEGTGTELPALTSIDLEPRQLRPDRDIALPFLALDTASEAVE